MAGIWGYKKGEGRYYQRVTGTKRFPDSGNIKSNGKVIGSEITGKHRFGRDKGRLKKTNSKVYRRHPIRRNGKVVGHRGGYTRRLR